MKRQVDSSGKHLPRELVKDWPASTQAGLHVQAESPAGEWARNWNTHSLEDLGDICTWHSPWPRGWEQQSFFLPTRRTDTGVHWFQALTGNSCRSTGWGPLWAMGVTCEREGASVLQLESTQRLTPRKIRQWARTRDEKACSNVVHDSRELLLSQNARPVAQSGRGDCIRLCNSEDESSGAEGSQMSVSHRREPQGVKGICGCPLGPGHCAQPLAWIPWLNRRSHLGLSCQGPQVSIWNHVVTSLVHFLTWPTVWTAHCCALGAHRQCHHNQVSWGGRSVPGPGGVPGLFSAAPWVGWKCSSVEGSGHHRYLVHPLRPLPPWSSGTTLHGITGPMQPLRALKTLLDPDLLWWVSVSSAGGPGLRSHLCLAFPVISSPGVETAVELQWTAESWGTAW